MADEKMSKKEDAGRFPRIPRTEHSLAMKDTVLMDAGGRPSKFTPETRQLILDCLKTGAPLNYAADYAGVGVRTIYDWLTLGKQEALTNPEGEYAKFVEDVKRAKMEPRLEALLEIRKAFKSDWRAAAHFLSKSDPENFGNKRDNKSSSSPSLNELLPPGAVVMLPRPKQVSKAQQKNALLPDGGNSYGDVLSIEAEPEMEEIEQEALPVEAGLDEVTDREEVEEELISLKQSSAFPEWEIEFLDQHTTVRLPDGLKPKELNEENTGSSADKKMKD